MSAEPFRVERALLGGRASLAACPVHVDARGALLPFAFDALPFVPCRSFAVTQVPAGMVRGGHAHRSCRQWLVCLNGRIEVLLRCAEGEARVTLVPHPARGLGIGPGVWSQQTFVDEGSVLLVFASEPFDPHSYLVEPGPAAPESVTAPGATAGSPSSGQACTA